MDPNVADTLTDFVQRKAALTPVHLEEINQRLNTFVEKCKGVGQTQDKDPEKFRQSIPYSIFHDLASLADYWLLTLDLASASTHELFCNICRFGRNATINSKRNQDFMADSGLVSVSIIILQDKAHRLCEQNLYAGLLLVRLAIQMASNSVVDNMEVAKKLAIQHSFFDTILDIFASFDDEQTRQYAAMAGCVMVNVLGYGTNVNVIIRGRRMDVFEAIMNDLGTEKFRLWFSAIVSSESFIPMVYEDVEFGRDVRVKMLKNITKYELPLEDESVACVRDVFKEMTRLAVTAQSCQIEELITEELISLVSLLTLLCSYNDKPRTSTLLQNDSQLVSLANRLLKTVHLLGKQSKNSLTPLEKIDQVKKAMSDTELHVSKTYSFKSDLVRLIGNLAYKHKPNQNISLDFEILPIILECTKIDGRNPFVPQCAIFAMRNLLDNNLENQNYVAQMNKVSRVGDG